MVVKSGGVIATQGADASGIVAQSIMGGGGVAGLTASASMTALLAGSVVTLGASQSGNNSLLANAGSVLVDLSSATGNANAPSVIATQGALSFGVLAQSIGGGGGYAALTSGDAPSALPVTRLTLGAQNDTGGAGSDVAVTVGNNVVVQTQGQNAHGVVAQSGGGGGGIAGLTTAPGLVTLAPVNNTFSNAGANDGGTVEVTVAGGIRTQGDGAAGVVSRAMRLP